MMNHILKDLLDNAVIVYINDFLIYTKNEDIHQELVQEVLERQAKNGVVMSREICVWGETQIECLWDILTSQGMRMAKEKTKAIQECRTLKWLKDGQLFLGFANFYRRFILGFSQMSRRLTESTKGDKNMVNGLRTS
jgi:hypothetical protein